MMPQNNSRTYRQNYRSNKARTKPSTQIQDQILPNLSVRKLPSYLQLLKEKEKNINKKIQKRGKNIWKSINKGITSASYNKHFIDICVTHSATAGVCQRVSLSSLQPDSLTTSIRPRSLAHQHWRFLTRIIKVMAVCFQFDILFPALFATFFRSFPFLRSFFISLVFFSSLITSKSRQWFRFIEWKNYRLINRKQTAAVKRYIQKLFSGLLLLANKHFQNSYSRKQQNNSRCCACFTGNLINCYLLPFRHFRKTFHFKKLVKAFS